MNLIDIFKLAKEQEVSITINYTQCGDLYMIKLVKDGFGISRAIYSNMANDAEGIGIIIDDLLRRLKQ